MSTPGTRCSISFRTTSWFRRGDPESIVDLGDGFGLLDQGYVERVLARRRGGGRQGDFLGQAVLVLALEDGDDARTAGGWNDDCLRRWDLAHEGRHAQVEAVRTTGGRQHGRGDRKSLQGRFGPGHLTGVPQAGDEAARGSSKTFPILGQWVGHGP